jgi:hypothetical protein
MSMSYDFCSARAREAATAAAEATLDNVRERALRAEAAWLVMAKRELSLQVAREKAKREKDAAVVAAAERLDDY